MRRANELGGSVRKGEHTQIVLFWRVDQIADVRPRVVTRTTRQTTSRRRFVLRYYRVNINLEQCQLPQAVLDKLPKIETHKHDPSRRPSGLSPGMPNPPDIQYPGAQAFLQSDQRSDHPTPREFFITAEEHFATLAHELSHPAREPKRLKRQSIAEAAPFGSTTYSFEKLVADFQGLICARRQASRRPS